LGLTGFWLTEGNNEGQGGWQVIGFRVSNDPEAPNLKRSVNVEIPVTKEVLD